MTAPSLTSRILLAVIALDLVVGLGTLAAGLALGVDALAAVRDVFISSAVVMGAC